MVAFKQNHDLLKPDHGFPVRMIIPGYIGTSVPWTSEPIDRLTLSTERIKRIHTTQNPNTQAGA